MRQRVAIAAIVAVLAALAGCGGGDGGGGGGEDRGTVKLKVGTLQVLGTGARSIDAPLVTLGKNYVNGAYVTTDEYLGENADVVERFA